MLQDPRQMQLSPRNMGGIIEGKKHHIPTICRAVRLGCHQNPRMEGMQHRSIAENEGKRFGFVPLGKINTKISRGVEDSLLDQGIDATVSVENPGNRSHTHVGRICNFPEARLLPFKSHAFQFLWNEMSFLNADCERCLFGNSVCGQVCPESGS
jgi:hypothetical protein